MRALTKFQDRNGNIRSNRKESHFHDEYVVIEPSNGRAVVTLRIYLTPKAAYACIWVNAFDIMHNSGGGRATGYGYHKPSAAVEAAINDAGFDLSESIGGVGDNAILKAIEAIAKEVTGKKKFYIHHAHA